jgi:acetyl-CoA carboxylase biotin carboxylase subunit
MGNKVRAREAAREAGLPLLPGSPGVVKDAAEARQWAEKIGLPVILKAAAGGGGRGMKIVRSLDAVAGAFNTASAEAVAALPALAGVSRTVATQIASDVRYAGYLVLEREQIERRRRQGARVIPEGLDYAAVRHLRAEAREKLDRVRPRTLEQAGRVSGITPADLAIVLVHLEGRGGA